MNQLLIDTGVFYAATNPADRHVTQARRILDAAIGGRFGRIFVTDHVVAEYLTLVRRKAPGGEEQARRFFPPDPAIPRLRIVHTTQTLFEDTLETFTIYREQGLSFTDANQLVMAEELGIYRIATFDKGFQGLVEVVDDAPPAPLPV